MALKGKSASITEVAEKSGVSLQTVSNVLNFPERVRPATREKVLAAIKSLDYTPNLAARRLRSARASSIAVRLDTNAVTEGEQRGLYSGFIQDEFVYQLTKAAQNRGIKVITYTADDQNEEIEKLRFLLNSQDADGLILTSTIGNDPRFKLLNEKKVPFITFGRPWGAANLYSTKKPWVDIDGAFGTALATRKFWEDGYRQIGFVGWKFKINHDADAQSVGEDRYNGWLKAIADLDKTKKSLSGKNFSALGDESVSSGRAMAIELLKKFPKVEAVVCVSDTVALGVLLESARLRKKPLVVSGFDNSPVSKEFDFSSLDQNLQMVAKNSIEILMGETGNQIRHVDFATESTKAHVLLRPVLIHR